MNLKDLSTFTASPWALVLGVVVLLVVWEGGKKWVPALVELLAGKVRDALGGTALVRGRALRTYRERVAARYARLPVLFMPDKGLDASTVYVPLQATEAGGDRRDDAYERIRATDHVVVLGRPGAGKTMLLRHSMLTWAADPTWRRTQRVPVLLELHRCVGDPRPLEEHVVAQFDEDGFPRAERFVRRALREGKLSLLFDGLDEVGSAERPRVVQLLRTFAARHPTCQIVVTCRTAVYDRQLAPEITTTFHVADLDDRHTRLFLRQWPLMADDTAAERLFVALAGTPRIMQLARNPLLLTMIAYLYGSRSQSQLVLPHSRAEFYREAIDVLLDRLKDARNVFKGPVKKAALIRIALAVQNTAESGDRRTLRFEDVLAEITAIAPRLNLDPSDAQALLEEITDRSGLLLRIDGGSRYQFAHLSLQEYLAAVAHEQDQAGLLANYRRAPDDWREVVKLWCGAVSVDCAPLVDTVFDLDEVLAFECLADAQVVDHKVADRITGHFQQRLFWVRELPRDVVSALGLVAADPRPRGRRVLRFLTSQAMSGTDRAFEPLAATRLLEAATTLVDLIDHPRARTAVVSMGDLAVPALAALATDDGVAESSATAAIDLLADIATPAAASALVPLLWATADGRSRGAAWHLAALIARPDIEAALTGLTVTHETPTHAWIWEPFRDRHNPTVARIAARTAQLVHSTPADQRVPAVGPLDRRLALPLLAFGLGEPLQEVLKPLPPTDEPAGTAFSPLRQHAYSCLGPELRAELLARVSHGVTATRQDWADVRRNRVEYRFHRSHAFWCCLALTATAVLLAGGAGVVAAGWSWGPTWLIRVLAVFSLLAVTAVLGASVRERGRGIEYVAVLHALSLVAYSWHHRRAEETWWNWVAAAMWAALLVLPILGWPLGSAPIVLLFGVAIGICLRLGVDEEGADVLLVGALSAGTTALTFMVGWHYLGWWFGTVAVLVAVATPMAVHAHGRRKERRARNPFRGLLELDEPTTKGRTSVIAA